MRVTRDSPEPEQPDAADAGFLGTTGLWVQQNKSTGEWSKPQAGYYRYLGVFWRLGAESATPFDRQRIALDTGDDMFGPEFRVALANGGGASLS